MTYYVNFLTETLLRTSTVFLKKIKRELLGKPPQKHLGQDSKLVLEAKQITRDGDEKESQKSAFNKFCQFN